MSLTAHNTSISVEEEMSNSVNLHCKRCKHTSNLHTSFHIVTVVHNSHVRQIVKMLELEMCHSYTVWLD